MRRLAVTTVLALAAVPAPALAAHAGPAEVLASGRGQAQCLTATPDGADVLFRAGGLRATGFGATPATRLGTADDCAAVGPVAGGGALAAAPTGTDGIALAERAPGGRFGTFAPLAAAGATLDTDAVDAVTGGGGQVLVAADVSGTPALVRRDAAGAVTMAALPGATDGEGPSVAVGLDGEGRGLVAYVRGTDVVAAPVGADGTVGTPVRLGRAPGLFDALRVAVSADGDAAVGWTARDEAAVATGTTTAGIDPATIRTGEVRGGVAMAVDPAGNAVAAGTRDVTAVRGAGVITTAAAGKPFTAPRTVRLDQGQDAPPAVALGAGGRFAVVLPRSAGVASTLNDLRLVSGPAGTTGGGARRVPTSASQVLEFGAAVDAEGRAVALVDQWRFVQGPRTGIARERHAITAHRVRSGPARRARGRVRIATQQRVGRRRQAVRTVVRCPVACTVRVTGATTGDSGQFEASVALSRGRHVLRVPYDNGGGSARFTPLRKPAVARLAVAVDDARGEWRDTVRVRIRP